MKSFRYYRYALPEDTGKENKKVLEILKTICFLIFFGFVVTVVMLLSR